VELRRALGAWDFPAARAAGARLSAEQESGTSLVPPRELLEGLVTAHLMTGDARGADSLFRLLLPRVAWTQGDLRVLLLAAYVETGIRPATVTPSGRPPTP
jgi:hypothetical protein